MKISINKNEYNLNLKLWLLSNALTLIQIATFFSLSIPAFCYHVGLNVAGNCRMCLVELEKAPKPIVACATPVTPNTNFFLNSAMAKKARENVLETLLINHPIDCPICDQAGECDLQENTKEFASDRNRNFDYERRTVEDKCTGVVIKTHMTRCIHCTRCVRFMGLIANTHSLKIFGRGMHTIIGTLVDHFFDSELTGNLIEICPVGALTSKPYAFKARNWELKKNNTIDNNDSICVPISAYTRTKSMAENYQKNIKNFENEEQILRITSFYDSQMNDTWISDKTRFTFDGLYKNRLKKPLCFLPFSNTLKLKNKIKTFNWYDFLKSESILYFNSFNIPTNHKKTNFLNTKKYTYATKKKISSSYVKI